jgi:arginyl-tRNA synthetase
MNIKEKINDAVAELSLGKEFAVEHPQDEKLGDYSTNIALVLASELKRNPRELAVDLIGKLQANKTLAEYVKDIEPAGPGFVNFYLKDEFLLSEVKRVLAEKEYFGSNKALADKKVMVEYTDPNPFKLFHIGHLMSNAIGESLSRLMEFQGADIRRANYQGDVGLHVAKCIYGLRELFAEKNIDIDQLEKMDLESRVGFMGEAYVRGAKEYEEMEKVKEEIDLLNKIIYKREDEKVNIVYDLGREWSMEYFDKIYLKLGTKFDESFYESEMSDLSLDLVNEFLKKGVFVKSKGAVVFEGERYGLHTRVFRNKLGLPTYEAKDLALMNTKFERFAYDLSVVVTANEINEYFKVLLKAASLIYPDLAIKTVHVGHGMLRLKNGKMSSRTGQVVTGESLMESVSEEIDKKMAETGRGKDIKDVERVVTKVAVGAIKYSMLKQSPGKDILFDFETSLSFEGDSGPYLQYAYARAMSVIEKSGKYEFLVKTDTKVSSEEKNLTRWMYRFPEIVEVSGKNLSPNLICSYLIELSSRFNLFYANCKIVGTDKEVFRLALTKAVSQILSNGLWLLGIETVEKM